VYIQTGQASLKNMPGHGGIRIWWDSYFSSLRFIFFKVGFIFFKPAIHIFQGGILFFQGGIHIFQAWDSDGGIHIFQACPVWIYTQSNITQASYSPEYITPKQQILYHVD
jgi:hypothetical protein